MLCVLLIYIFVKHMYARPPLLSITHWTYITCTRACVCLVLQKVYNDTYIGTTAIYNARAYMTMRFLFFVLFVSGAGPDGRAYPRVSLTTTVVATTVVHGTASRLHSDRPKFPSAKQK